MELVYAEGAAYEGLNGGGMVGGFELCRLGEDIYGGIVSFLFLALVSFSALQLTFNIVFS